MEVLHWQSLLVLVGIPCIWTIVLTVFLYRTMRQHILQKKGEIPLEEQQNVQIQSITFIVLFSALMLANAAYGAVVYTLATNAGIWLFEDVLSFVQQFLF